MIFIFWIFAIPHINTGQRTQKENPLNILKKGLANGQINKEEYLEK
ncbi:MAG: putative membrane protein, partial [Cyclobacteriaceae bacterium]